jgi:amino acid transporter
MNNNKTIVKIGWGLLGFILACYFLVALISVFQGDGGFMVAHSFSGKPSVFSPMVVFPTFVIAIAIGIYWVGKVISKKLRSKRNENGIQHHKH